MYKVVKDGLTTYVKDQAFLTMYLDNGWKIAKDKIEKEPELELTKKQLQTKLDELQVDYKPQENKSTLMDKLKKALPADNFDDGLLKG